MTQQTERFSVRIEGQVQGVGFRPWVFRLAARTPLSGFVRNTAAGVIIEVQGTSDNVKSFMLSLKAGEDAPPLARISRLQSTAIPPIQDECGFSIVDSDASGPPAASVTPDTAVCGECLAELHDPTYFRYGYPFINCTNCGPRYTIVRSVPYDRPATTMASFSMCDRCAAEYRAPQNRRFHAQPVACPVCGPHLELVDAAGKAVAAGDADILSTAARMLAEGRILAIKGIGGFHLAVDACNDEAVRLLRSRKHREHKPFAMMARLDVIRSCADVPPLAQSILSSPEGPVVLLSQKAGSPVAPSVAPGTNTFGFMLPYAPLHHLLFDQFARKGKVGILVMTSANLADQPLIYRNDEAVEKLSGIADLFLMHDRNIYRQLDDSVVHLIGDTPAPLRRARGYVPSPIYSPIPSSRPILAAGSDLKNTFCLACGDRFIVSEHIGDLEDADVYKHYCRSISHLSALFDFRPSLVVTDLHPGYFSTQYAASLKDVETIHVQHHWAHIASVLAEHNKPGPVIGLAADGTGYGPDGAIWGCECLVASLSGFERFAHLKYFPLAGGDKASKEPIRSLMALLHQAEDGRTGNDHRWLFERIEPDGARVSLIGEQLRRNLNTVPTSSLGRVFDAVAAATGLGNFNNFEAQLPIALEAAADWSCTETYEFDIVEGQPLELNLARMLVAIVDDVRRGMPISVISARFHNTVAAALADIAGRARSATGLGTVALSGGVFCNRLLTTRTIDMLNRDGFEVLYNTVVPANDGGLSLGQAAIAAELTRNKRG